MAKTSTHSGEGNVSGKGHLFVAVLLVACVVVVAFWEIMSNRSRRPLQPFGITAGDFANFEPRSDRWDIQSLPVPEDPIEPNILAYLLHPGFGEPGTGSNGPVLVRLVHGYNMRDCMRIKGYQVELIADTRVDVSGMALNVSDGELGMKRLKAKLPKQLQVWRLTSATGDVSIWITAMLRVGDFSRTNVDSRSMAFPRVGIPDDPGWAPRGMTLKGLRHPVRNTRLFLRSKWNSSRADLLTFLGLKQPAWASDDLLTLVAGSRGTSVGQEEELSVAVRVLSVHLHMHSELKAWRLRMLESIGY